MLEIGTQLNQRTGAIAMSVHIPVQGQTLADYMRSSHPEVVVATNFKLGDGVDLNHSDRPKQQIASDDWISSPNEQITPGVPTSCFSAYLSSEAAVSNASRSMNVDASGAVGVSNFSAAYSNSSVSEMSSEQDSVVVSVHAWSYCGYKALFMDSPKWSVEASNAADAGGDAFKAICGTDFVKVVHYGASVDALLSISSTNQGDRESVAQQLSLSAGGLWGGADLTASWSSDQLKTLERCTISIKADWYCNEDPASPFPQAVTGSNQRETLQKFSAAANQMSAYLPIKGRERPIGYEHVPVSDVFEIDLGAPPALPPWADERQQKLEFLYGCWVRLKNWQDHLDELANQSFAPGDDGIGTIFSTAGHLCAVGKTNIQQLASDLANNSQNLSESDVDNISNSTIMVVKIDDSGTKDLLGITSSQYDLRDLPALQKLNDAKKAYPLRLELTLDSITGGIYNGPDGGGSTPQDWTVGFNVLQDAGEVEGGELAIHSLKPGEWNQPQSAEFLDIGCSIVINLTSDWKTLSINPFFITDKPTHPPDYGMPPNNISKNKLISTLKNGGQLSLQRCMFTYQPSCSIIGAHYDLKLASL